MALRPTAISLGPQCSSLVSERKLHDLVDSRCGHDQADLRVQRCWCGCMLDIPTCKARKSRAWPRRLHSQQMWVGVHHCMRWACRNTIPTVGLRDSDAPESSAGGIPGGHILAGSETCCSDSYAPNGCDTRWGPRERKRKGSKRDGERGTRGARRRRRCIRRRKVDSDGGRTQ